MIEAHPQLSIRRQGGLLSVGRSGVYYEAVGVTSEELALMRRIDEIHLQYPFYGSRNIAHLLSASGEKNNPKSGQLLRRRAAIESRPSDIPPTRDVRFHGPAGDGAGAEAVLSLGPGK